MSTPVFVPTTSVDGNALDGTAAGNTPGVKPKTMLGRVTLQRLPPLELGTMLRPLSPEDDLLEEMLE